jgi:hypothetical protein
MDTPLFVHTSKQILEHLKAIRIPNDHPTAQWYSEVECKMVQELVRDAMVRCVCACGRAGGRADGQAGEGTVLCARPFAWPWVS